MDARVPPGTGVGAALSPAVPSRGRSPNRGLDEPRQLPLLSCVVCRRDLEQGGLSICQSVQWGFCSKGSALGHLLASHLAPRPSSLSWALLRHLWGRWCQGHGWAWWACPLWWAGLSRGRGASWLPVAALLLNCLLCSGQLARGPCSPSSWCFCPNRVRLPLNFCYQVTRNTKEEK